MWTPWLASTAILFLFALTPTKAGSRATDAKGGRGSCHPGFFCAVLSFSWSVLRLQPDEACPSERLLSTRPIELMSRLQSSTATQGVLP